MYFQVNVDNSKKLISVGGGVVVEKNPRFWRCYDNYFQRKGINRLLTFAIFSNVQVKVKKHSSLSQFVSYKLNDFGSDIVLMFLKGNLLLLLFCCNSFWPSAHNCMCPTSRNITKLDQV